MIATTTAYLPIITKARELDSRLLQTISLTRAGYVVVVGETTSVTDRAFESAPGIYMTPILVPMTADRLLSLRRRGCLLIGWDEEGLVYPEAKWYVEDRLDPRSLERLDLFVTWGEQPRQDVLQTRRVDTEVRALGNPRIDLLRDPLRGIYQEEARAHREKFGPYILVNTNFDLVNHPDGSDAFLDRFRASGRLVSEADERRFIAWADFRRSIFEAFLQGLPYLARTLPDFAFVVRPHPSEALAPWLEIEARVDNVHVAPPRSTVIPWIQGADAVLHNSCTTAIEAYVLEKPVVAFRPEVPHSEMESPLPNDLSRCGTGWEEVAMLLAACRQHGADPQPEQRNVATRWMANLDGPLAADRITLATRSIDGKFTTIARRRAFRQWRASPPAAAIRRARGREGLAAPRPSDTRDSRQRFPGLELHEVEQRIGRLCERLEFPCPKVGKIGENAFQVEPA